MAAREYTMVGYLYGCDASAKSCIGFLLWNFNYHIMNSVVYVGMLLTHMLNEHFSTLDVPFDAGRVKRSLKKSVQDAKQTCTE